MKKRLKILWTIVAATMFLMMPADLQAQNLWPRGGIKVTIEGGYGWLDISSQSGPLGIFGRREYKIGGGAAYDKELLFDYQYLDAKWNFEVIYHPGSSGLWKMEIWSLEKNKLMMTYYPEDLQDNGDGEYEYEVSNALTLDGMWLRWYTLHNTQRWVEIVPYLHENNYGPAVPSNEDEVGKGTAYDDRGYAVGHSTFGDVLTLVPYPNPGYAFKRWEVIKGFSALRGDELKLTGDTRVAAVFMPVTQAVVTFDPQGGTLESTTANPNAEGKITSLPTPVRGDYGFRGWYDEDGNEFTTNTVVKRNMTVYARWDQGLYVGTTELNFGRVLEGYAEIPSKPIRVQNLYGTQVRHAAEGANSNYQMSWKGQRLEPGEESEIWVRPRIDRAPGIYDATAYVVNEKDTVRHPVSLKFEVVPSHTITFYGNGGVADFTEAKTDINGRLGGFPNVKMAGYHFIGWYDSLDLDSNGKPIGNRYEHNQYTRPTFSGPMTLYAMWDDGVSLDKQVLDFGTVKKGYSPVDPQMVVVKNSTNFPLEVLDQYDLTFYDTSTKKFYSLDESPYLVAKEEGGLEGVELSSRGITTWNQVFKVCYRPKDNLPPGNYNLMAGIGWGGKDVVGGGTEWFNIKFTVEDDDPEPSLPDDGEKRVMQMNTAGIENLNTIYYGRNYTNLTSYGKAGGFHYDEAVPSWYVVDNQKDILGNLGGMYLLAKTLYGSEGGGLIPYNGDFFYGRDDYWGATRWQEGFVLRSCFGVLWRNNFSNLEKGAVRNIQKTEEEIDESTEEGEFICMANTVDDTLFPLSLNEAAALPAEIAEATYKGEAHDWWLRNIERVLTNVSYFRNDTLKITIVFRKEEDKKKFEEDYFSAPQWAFAPAKAAQKGPRKSNFYTSYTYKYIALPWTCRNEGLYRTAPERSGQGLRPAMNIDKDWVFMSSAAVGGKESGPLGSGALRKVRKSNPTEWKLTLIDTLRTGFTVAVDGFTPTTGTSVNVNRRVINSGDSMTIHYSGAPTGPNEFVSVALKRSSDNEVLYYGTIAANRASGDVTIPIPNDLETDQLHEVLIFSEQKNGDYYTDYVSPAATYYIQMEKTEVILLDDDYPFDEGDDPYNTIVINRNKGFDTKYAKINGRTLCRDGRWNTICLPFGLSSFAGTPLADATVKQLVSSNYNASTGTLTLNFETVSAIEAGKPYIVKWASGENVANPVFNGVTISDAGAGVTETEYTDFIGLYSSIYIGGLDRTMLYMGGDSKLYYPNDEMFINSFRGYFRLKKNLWASDIPGTADAKTFVVNLGGETTGLTAVESGQLTVDSWYSVDGVKLKGEPTRKGVYIRNGRKMVVK